MVSGSVTVVGGGSESDFMSWESHWNLFGNSSEEEEVRTDSLTAISTPIGTDSITNLVTKSTENPPITFTFGRRSFTLVNDGTTIATHIWTSGLVAGHLIHEGSFLGAESAADAQKSVRSEAAESAADGSLPIPTALDVTGLDVLEIGCGCSLAGLAAALHGCKSLTLADCDDRALMSLFATYQPDQPGYRTWWRYAASDVGNIVKKNDNFHDTSTTASTAVCGDLRFHHHLWEEDLRVVEAVENNRSSSKPFVPLPHWSDAHRNLEHPGCQVLDASQTFDVIIASDCLYFASQELPLVAVLKLRLRKSTKAFGLILIQTRSNGGYQRIRLVESLQAAGFHVEQRCPAAASGGIEEIYSRHMSCGTPVSSRSTEAPASGKVSSDSARTANTPPVSRKVSSDLLTATSLEGEKHVLIVRWKSQLSA